MNPHYHRLRAGREISRRCSGRSARQPTHSVKRKSSLVANRPRAARAVSHAHSIRRANRIIRICAFRVVGTQRSANASSENFVSSRRRAHDNRPVSTARAVLIIGDDQPEYISSRGVVCMRRGRGRSVRRAVAPLPDIRRDCAISIVTRAGINRHWQRRVARKRIGDKARYRQSVGRHCHRKRNRVTGRVFITSWIILASDVI